MKTFKTTMRLELLVLILSVQVTSAFYDPHIGRWLSRDPIGESGGRNLYALIKNTPLNNYDVLGLDDSPKSSYPNAKWETVKKIPGDCGVFTWEVKWSLDAPAPNLGNNSRGYIIQKVDISFNVEDCYGTKFENDNIRSKLGFDRWWWPYWEAFGPFKPDKQDGVANDTFSMSKANVGMSCRTRGSFTMTGVAQYLPWATLPDTFHKHSASGANPANMPFLSAGDKVGEPDLTLGTQSVTRSITVKWDCCNKPQKSELSE